MPKITIKCEHLSSRTPLPLELKVRPKSTVTRLKQQIAESLAIDPKCIMESFTKWFVEILADPTDDTSSKRLVEITTEDGYRTLREMGVVDKSVILLEGDLLSEEQIEARTITAQAKEAALQRKITQEMSDKYLAMPLAPLQALWKALRTPTVSADVIVAIALDTRCGIEHMHVVKGGGSGFLRRHVPDGLFAEVTPLMAATFAGRLDAMQALIEAGAKVQGPNTWSFTALHASALTHNAAAIELLVNNGANVFTRGRYQRDFVPLEVGYGKNTLLHVAAGYGRPHTLKLMISKGLSVQVTNASGAAPLCVAAQQGNLSAVDTLLELGAQIDATNRDGSTALYAALSNNQLEAAKKLLSYGARISSSYSLCASPLHHAAETDNVRIPQLLMDLGADIDALDHQSHRTPIFVAAAKGMCSSLKLLIDAGATVNTSDRGGDTPLHFACQLWLNATAVQLLLAHGANINAINSSGKTPFHCSLKHGCYETTAQLLRLGADVNAKDNAGNTPLHMSRLYGENFVQILIANGADVRAKNKDGNTPLHNVAALSDAYVQVKLLRSEGADLTALNVRKQTPLDVFNQNNHYYYYNSRQDKKAQITQLLTPKHMKDRQDAISRALNQLD